MNLTRTQNVPKEVIRTTKKFRDRLLSDPYRPAYHFCIPEGWGIPFDPNGAFFYNGKYHLMYLYNRGDGFAWGHVTSIDLLHWRNHPDAIGPYKGDGGTFSGGAFVDSNGEATLSFWKLGDQTGISIAQSKDKGVDKWSRRLNGPVVLSTEWGITDLKDSSGKIIHIGSADPSNIWKKNGRYYMITGNLLVLRRYGSRGKGLPANNENAPPLPADSVKYQGDHAYLFVSDDLNHWDYLHEFYQSQRKWTDKTEDIMCPNFLPLPSSPNGGKPSGKYLLLFISHNRGCQYYIGDYKENKFFPTHHGRMTWKDNAYFAPEALVDGKGRQIMWSWIFEDRSDSIKRFYGWTGGYGLPRTLWLGDDGTLRMRPIKELKNLRLNEMVKDNLIIKAGSSIKLKGFGSELLELEITAQVGNAKEFGVKVDCSEDGREQTIIYYDNVEKMLKVDTRKSGLSFGRKIIESAPFKLKTGEILKLRVFVDKSIVEVYANDRQAIARRVYPTLGETGVILFAKGSDVKILSVKRWDIMPSNPY